MASGIREPFFSHGYAEIEKISGEISNNMENLSELMRELESHEARLGTKSDTKQFRSKLNETKTEALSTTKSIIDLLRQLKDLQPKKQDDKEYKNKVQRRLQEAFNKQNKTFTDLLNQVQKKEKEKLELKRSMIGGKLKSSVSSSVASEDDLEMAAQIQDIDFTEALLKEREKDIQDVRRLAHELNLTAQFQAQKIAEGSNDLEVIENDMGFTEKKAEEANNHLDKALQSTSKTSKKNLIICLSVFFVCSVIIAIVVSQNS